MGIKTIMMAKSILLLASGSNKAEIVKHSFFGEIMPSVPASILQLHHNVTVVLDNDAGENIKMYI
jgi:glucosamine-6-phosphate deaminase